MLEYDQNILLDSIYIKHLNGLSYQRQPFHCPTSVVHVGIDCKVEYTDTNQAILPDMDHSSVQDADSDIDNTFRGKVLSFPVLYFS